MRHLIGHLPRCTWVYGRTNHRISGYIDDFG